jgi:hypothetical protein
MWTCPECRAQLKKKGEPGMSVEGIKKQLTDRNVWAEKIASKCKCSYQKYFAIPPLKPTCKLTSEPCDFDICPKREG